MSDLNQVKLVIAESSLDYVKALEKSNRTYLSDVLRLEIERRLKAEARAIVYVGYIVAGISLTHAILTTGIVRGGVAYALMAVFGWTSLAVGNRLAARHVSRHLDQLLHDRVDQADRGAAEAYAHMQQRREQLLAPFGPPTKDPLNQEAHS